MGSQFNIEKGSWQCILFMLGIILMFVGLVMWVVTNLVRKRRRLAQKAKEDAQREVRIQHHAAMIREKQRNESRMAEYIQRRKREMAKHKKEGKRGDPPRTRSLPYGGSEDPTEEMTEDRTESNSNNEAVLYAEC